MKTFLIILLVYLIGAGYYFCVICNWLCKGIIDRHYANPIVFMINMLLWPYALFMWILMKLLRLFRSNEPEEKEEKHDNVRS